MIVQTVLGGKKICQKIKSRPLVTAVFASTLLLSGCGLFGKEVQKKVDPPNRLQKRKQTRLRKPPVKVKKLKEQKPNYT